MRKSNVRVETVAPAVPTTIVGKKEPKSMSFHVLSFVDLRVIVGHQCFKKLFHGHLSASAISHAYRTVLGFTSWIILMSKEGTMTSGKDRTSGPQLCLRSIIGQRVQGLLRNSFRPSFNGTALFIDAEMDPAKLLRSLLSSHHVHE